MEGCDVEPGDWLHQGGLRPKSNGRELDGREWSDFPKPVLPYPIAAE
jgi:protein gp37